MASALFPSNQSLASPLPPNWCSPRTAFWRITSSLGFSKEAAFSTSNKSFGFTDDNIAKLIVKDPKNITFASGEKLQETLLRVENDLGIPFEAASFPDGIFVVRSFSR